MKVINPLVLETHLDKYSPLSSNTVKVFAGAEFDKNNFDCLQMLTNHDPGMVSNVAVDGNDTVTIYYLDGTTRKVTTEDRRVLWEKYTEFLIELKKKMLPPAKKEIPKKRIFSDTECEDAEYK